MSKVTKDGGKIPSFANNKCLVCGVSSDQLLETRLTVNISDPNPGEQGNLIPTTFLVGVCDNHRHTGPSTTTDIQAYIVGLLNAAKTELGLTVS